MEELHSTEVLDREILEDARKRAFRILKSAEDAAGAVAAKWKKQTGRELEALKKNYAQRLGTAREEIMAVLPLDKKRRRSERGERLLHDQMAAFLGGLDRESLKRLLEGELSRRLEECAEFDFTGARVLCRGLDAGEAEALLEKVLGKGKRFSVNPGDPAFIREGKFQGESGSLPGLLLDVPGLRISVSVDDAAEAILREKRAELASALLGEEALND
jgi:hypothetical protein